jgi:tartrate dehydratase beta subunit/fumarate hydratase class I family protein
MRKIDLPLSKDTARSLKAGEEVLLSGVILCCAGTRHTSVLKLSLHQGSPFPFELMDRSCTTWALHLRLLFSFNSAHAGPVDCGADGCLYPSPYRTRF